MTHDKEIEALVEAGERVNEYLRQLSPMRGLDREVIHQVHSDTKSRPAKLLVSDLKALLAENKRYREALEFYAKGANYRCPRSGEVDYIEDNGYRARQALNPSEEE